MSYYKVTFAVESKALSTTLETLALGIREGVISKSFVVEREEELLNPAAHVETPPRIKATTTRQNTDDGELAKASTGASSRLWPITHARMGPAPTGGLRTRCRRRASLGLAWAAPSTGRLQTAS